MSDEPEPPAPVLANEESPGTRVVRQYLDSEKFTAVAAVDINGGNVHRTALALGIPYRTLHGWVKARDERLPPFGDGSLVKEKRGDLATKLESLLHSLIESMPSKIDKATLSQTAVTTGIVFDKLRIAKGVGLEPDFRMEICRILGINQAQLPESLQLQPGEEIPEEFRQFLDLAPDAAGIFAVPSPPAQYSHPAFGTLTQAEPQADIPDTYLRVKNAAGDVFILAQADLTLIEQEEPRGPESSDDQDSRMLLSLDDDSEPSA